jgi:hypothetical protein
MGYSIERLFSFLNSPHNASQAQAAKASWGDIGWKRVVMQKLAITLISLTLICISLSPDTIWAKTITATNCSRASVETAVNSATHGDTVLVPAGTCAWKTNLNITIGITLEGAGIGRTVILDQTPKDGSVPGSSVLAFAVDSPNNFRLTGFTFQEDTNDVNVFAKCMIALNGTSHAFRIDHNAFTTTGDASYRGGRIRLYGYLWGVIDHNEFRQNFELGVYADHSRWNGGSYGDGSWADALYLGTEKAIYIEDNVFTELANPYSVGAIDGLEGYRIVFRYNTLYNNTIVAHGTESGGRLRSARSFEIYNNKFIITAGAKNLSEAFEIRGGTGVIFNNKFYREDIPSNGGYNSLATLKIFRDDKFFPPWGKCDGSSSFDQNITGSNGYRCVDQPGAGTSSDLAGIAIPSATWVGNILDPIYQWNNAFGSIGTPILSTQGAFAATHLVEGRDYFNNTPKPGYVPLIYPHPLVTNSAKYLPSPPTKLTIK